MPRPRSSTTNHHRSGNTTKRRLNPPTDGGANPFENFTVSKKSSSAAGTSGPGPHQSIRSSEIPGQRSKNRLPLSATVAIAGHSSHFNPLGQVEGDSTPALIPENEEEEGGYDGRSLSMDNDGDLPLIDDWLVDDMSSSRNKDQLPAKRRKHHQLSSGASRKEVRSFLEGSTCNPLSATASQGGCGRKRPLQQKNQTAAAGLSLKKRSSSSSVSVSGASRQCMNDEQNSTNKKRKTITVEDSSSDSDERFLDSVIIGEDDVMDSDSTSTNTGSHLHTGAPFYSTNIAASSSRGVGSPTVSTFHSRFSGSSIPTLRNSNEQQSSLFPHQSASSRHHPHIATYARSSNTRIDSTTTLNRQFQTDLPPEYATATANSASNISTTYNMSYSDMPPLFRIRVKIESKSYLIPCPRKDSSGRDTTVQWLISEASERHYTQQGLGARPRLSLTTSDGAILCPTDLVSHVLSPDEEVVGVVEGWVEETLEESYLAVCKKERVGE